MATKREPIRQIPKQPSRREEGPTPHRKEQGEQRGTESGGTGRPQKVIKLQITMISIPIAINIAEPMFAILVSLL